MLSQTTTKSVDVANTATPLHTCGKHGCKNATRGANKYCDEHNRRQVTDVSTSADDLLREIQDALATPALVFHSARQMVDATPEHPDWVWDGYLAAGVITVLAGLPKRQGGKSRFAWALVRAMLERHESFVGRFLAGGPVVYLTEEPASMLRPKVEPLADLPGLSVAYREITPRPKPSWDESIAQAAAECERIGARLLVIDTFADWANLKAEAEKDSGAVQAAMDALMEAAARGLAVLLIHHHRKAGGEDGAGLRGSGALLGAVDIAVDLTRVGDDDDPGTSRQRILNASSRWTDTPESMIVELMPDGGGYTLISEGERAEVKRLAAHAPILEALADAVDGKTSADLVDALGINQSNVSRAVGALLAAGDVVRVGAGLKGDPYRYRLPEGMR